MRRKISPEERWMQRSGWTVKWGWLDKGTLGLCRFATKEIIINLARLIVPILIHEYKHAIRKPYNPKDKEKDDFEHEIVEEYEEKRMKELSADQIIALASAILKKIGEDDKLAKERANERTRPKKNHQG
jgi:hypothetical protein